MQLVGNSPNKQTLCSTAHTVGVTKHLDTDGAESSNLSSIRVTKFLLEKLIVYLLVKIFPTFYRTIRLILSV
jgi:hypothetical protein